MFEADDVVGYIFTDLKKVIYELNDAANIEIMEKFINERIKSKGNEEKENFNIQ